MESKPKTIIVTGSNKGIGYGIVEGLAKQGTKWSIIMACRNLQLAKKSQAEITAKYPNAIIDCLELDISNTESIDKFIETLSAKKIGIDVLVNNAGINAKGQQVSIDLVKSIFSTNFYGTVDLSEKIVPYMNQNGKIIIVGSIAGKFHRSIKNQNLDLLQRWNKQNLTREQLFANVDHYFESVKKENYDTLGYLKYPYGTSKMSINLFANIFGRSQAILNKHIQVYTLCPGYVGTDLTNYKGPLTIQQGAQTPLYLINFPFQINPKYQGGFFQKSRLSSLQ